MERLRFQCMKCLVKKLNDIPDTLPEEIKLRYTQRFFRILAEAPMSASAPVIVSRINEAKREMLGLWDEYGEVKRHFNEFMLGLMPGIREKIRQAEDPLLAALQYAMVGNYIDLGAMERVEEERLLKLLDTASQIRPDPVPYQALRRDLDRGGRLLLITDNCGEVVMDRLLIETLQRLYPALDIAVLVRGKPVLNDATLEDARQVGLTELVPVLDNGTGIAGTNLESITPEARQAFEQADVIISKGQGNFETLRKCGANVYYLFLCKCDIFAREFGVPMLSGILCHDSQCRQ